MLLKSLQLNLRNIRNVFHVPNIESCLIIRYQKYGRFAPRKISAIVNEDELFDIEENTTPPLPEEKKKPKSKLRRNKADAVQIDKETLFETTDEKPVKLPRAINTKLYENEKSITSLMIQVQSKKQRKKNNLIILEGKRLMLDAIKVGLIPKQIIFSRLQDVNDLPISKINTQLIKIPYRTIQLWSSLSTSPGILGIFEKPKPVEVSSSSLPLTIICDNIRDPQNMGSILRAAAGVGCEKVILTKGCVDFWDTKVVRSGTGAHFRIPVHDAQEWSDIESIISSDAYVFVADNNVNFNICIEKNQDNEENTSTKSQNRGINKKYNVIKKLNNFNVIHYYDADYTKNEVILIVGGETEGLSLESLEFMENRKGVRVNIPLANDIDSLNAGVALGIIAFEIKKQFLSKSNWKELMQ